MKVQQVIHNEVEIDDEIHKASIDTANLHFVFSTLSKMYSDPYGSIVRELTSNCFDAHVQKGITNKSVIVGFEYDNNENKYIIFRDFGVGMNPDFMKKTFMKFMSSTKRESDDVFGMFGLGSKSPLSIKDDFIIISVVDNIQYEYIVFKGEDGIPSFNILSTKEVSQESGTTIKIPIDDWNEQYQFQEAFKNQLKYFNQVHYKNLFGNIANHYKILNFNNFVINSEISKDKLYADICYDRVFYRIDWIKIKLPDFKIPIGLKFKIGQLQVTPSREDIVYNEREISIIRNKIKSACYEIIGRFNKTVRNVDDYDEYLEIKDESKIHIKFDVKKLNNKGEETGEEVRKHIKFLNAEYCYNYLLKNFGIDHEVKSNGFTPFSKYGIQTDISFDLLTTYILNGEFSVLESGYKSRKDVESFYLKRSLDKGCVYRISDDTKIDKLKNITISLNSSETPILVSKRKNPKRFRFLIRDLRDIEYNSKKISHLKACSIIYREVFKWVINKTKRYEDIIISQDAYDVLEKQKNLSNSNITYYDVYDYKKNGKRITGNITKTYNYKNSKYVIGSKSDMKFLFFISYILNNNDHNNYDLFDKKEGYKREYKKYKFIYATETNKKRILKYDKVMSLEKFTQESVFKKICIAAIIHRDFHKYFTNNFIDIIGIFNNEIYEDLLELNKIYLNYHVKDIQYSYKSKLSIKENKEFFNSLAEIALKEKLYDRSLKVKLDRVDKYLKNVEFLYYVSIKNIHNNTDAILDISNMLKKLCIRINSNFYKTYIKKYAYEQELLLEGRLKQNYLRSIKNYKNGRI